MSVCVYAGPHTCEWRPEVDIRNLSKVFYTFYSLFCVHVWMYVRGQLAGVVLFYHVDPRNHTPAVGLGGRHLYLLGHLTSLPFFFFFWDSGSYWINQAAGLTELHGCSCPCFHPHSYIPRRGVIDDLPRHLVLHGCWGSKFRSSWLCRSFTDQAISSVLPLCTQCFLLKARVHKSLHFTFT